MKLQKQYESVCNEYIKEFCKKQGMYFEFWVGEPGNIAYFGDVYLEFRDIVWDVNSNQPKGFILEWYFNVIDDPENACNYYYYSQKVGKKRGKGVEL